ncbi:MAG: 8-oxo-dGTP diphosphatase [Oscillospiraceae bacterium]|nr:8-oxo-dGTP diphosphatase [Oscillospiraceae bacterium]
MERKETVTLTNMCMIYDSKGNVLVQDRVNKKWSGMTFPGGHVEKGESFIDSVIREVKEETGLTVSDLRICGIKQWMDDDSRYIVLCYKTNKFEGELCSSEEGEMRWIKLDELLGMHLASGMKHTLRLFLEDGSNEHVCYMENGEAVNIVI